MTTAQALQKLGDVIRRKHFALATERSYGAWLKRYCDFIQRLPTALPSEQKLERFLTALAREDVAASTQNQAFNALLFFYKEVLGAELRNVQSLRARRPAQVRRAPRRARRRCGCSWPCSRTPALPSAWPRACCMGAACG
jgi:site-specific recombinase XerD